MERTARPAAPVYAMPLIAEPITVAVADDHDVFKQGVIALLALEDDIRVIGTAGDGSEVLRLLERSRPDVLLLDLRMPGMGGLAALRRLSRFDLPTRIIVLTASENQDEYVEAMSAGASAVLLKPRATDCLADCIRAVHEGEIWLDEDALPLPEGGSSSVVPV